MKNNKKVNLIIFIILIIFFSISVVEKTFQNDTYFTIVVGEKILNEGIYTDEDFSWHEGLKYQNVRWIFDVLVAKTYNIFGFAGIYALVLLIASLIGLTVFYILIKQRNSYLISFLLTLCAIYLSKGVLAARAQILSFYIFILEYYFIYKLYETGDKKNIIILFVLSILLANTHASVYPLFFVFFMPYFAEFILYKVIRNNAEDNKIICETNNNILILFISMIISALGGLITPIGLAPFVNMFKTVNEISSDIISEMRSLVPAVDYHFAFYISVVVAVVGFTKIKVHLRDLLYIFGFGILSLSTIRSEYFIYLICIFPLAKMITEFIESYDFKIYLTQKNKNILLTICAILILIISAKNFATRIVHEYVDTSMYPIDAADFILENLDINNIRLFNHFNFGSYLEYKGIPVFIDSRAEIYLDSFNNKNILKDWSDATTLNGYKKIFDKYDITHAILYTNESIANLICEDDEWKMIYRDNCFCVYEKVK